MFSVPTPSAQTQSTQQQSSSGTGTGQGIGVDLKLGSRLVSTQPTAPAPSLSLLPPLLATSTSSTSLPPSTTTPSSSDTSHQQAAHAQQQAQTQHQTVQHQVVQHQVVQHQAVQQQPMPPPVTQQLLGQPQSLPMFGLSSSLLSSSSLSSAPVFGSLSQQSTLSTLATPSNSSSVAATATSSSTSSAVSTAALSLPSLPPLSTNTAPQIQPSFGGPSTQPQQSLILNPPTAMANTASKPGAVNSSAPLQGLGVGGFNFGSGGLQFSTAGGSGTGTGFSFPSLSQTNSTGQTSNVQHSLVQSSSVPLQNSVSSGGSFKLGQTPQSVTASGGAPPTFNFGGGGSGFGFSSGGLTQPPQAPQQPIFGGGLQQPPSNPGVLSIGGNLNNPGGLTLGGLKNNNSGGLGLGGSSSGGIFGTPSAPTTATSAGPPSFNFSGSSSATPQPLKLSGGIFGNSSLGQPPPAAVNQTSFNFGSAQPPQQQQQQLQQQPKNRTGGMFSFSAAQKQPQREQQGMLPGGGGGGGTGQVGFGGTSGVFNFSAMTGKTGENSLGVSGSSGLQFGLSAQPPQGGGGFQFSAGSNSVPGGLKFGSTGPPGNQMSGAPGGGMFGSAPTNQMQAGGMFGQSTPQNNPSSTGTLFNSSLTTPSKPAVQQQQQQLGGFGFTPQQSVGGFNFSGAAGGTPGGPAVFGSPSGALFSAGTPQGNESSRPVATARRRRGRRK